MKKLLGTLILAVSLTSNSYAFRYGQMYLNIEGDITQMYDDNITYARQNNAEDSTTNLTARVIHRYIGQRTNFLISGSLSHQIFSKYNSFNNTSNEFNVSYQNELSDQDRLRITNTYRQTNEPQSFEETLERGNGRYSYFSNHLGFAYSHDLNTNFSFTGNYRFNNDRTSRNNLLNSYLNGAGLRTTYNYSSSFALYATYDFSLRHFENERTFSNHRTMGGIKKYLTKQLSVDGSVGVSNLYTNDGKRFNSPSLSASISNEVSERSGISFSYTRDQEINPHIEDFSDSKRVSTLLTRQISERVSASFTVFYGSTYYTNINITDELLGGNAVFNYHFTEGFTTSVSYHHARIHSTLQTRDYVKNRVFLGFAAGF